MKPKTLIFSQSTQANAREYFKYIQSLLARYRTAIMDAVDKNYYVGNVNLARIMEKLQAAQEHADENIQKRARRVIQTELDSIAGRMRRNINGKIKEQELPIPEVPKKESRDNKNLTTAFIVLNVAILHNLFADLTTKVMGQIRQGEVSNMSREELIAYLRERYGMTKRRAQKIAVGEMARAQQEITINELNRIGVTQGRWIHSKKSKVPRKTHLAMNGKVFDLDKGVWDSTEQKWVKPRELYGCNCSFRPIIETEND
jgi:SPP1 gp7 family putative phage head morphogenesis protein